MKELFVLVSWLVGSHLWSAFLPVVFVTRIVFDSLYLWVCGTAPPPLSRENLLHSLGAAGPIAVEYVHLLALEDEGAETVLRDTHTHNVSSLPPGGSRKRINLDRYGMGGTYPAHGHLR